MRRATSTSRHVRSVILERIAVIYGPTGIDVTSIRYMYRGDWRFGILPPVGQF